MLARLLRYEKVELIWGAVSAAMTPKNASIRHIKIPKKCVSDNKIRCGIMFFKIRLHIDPLKGTLIAVVFFKSDMK